MSFRSLICINEDLLSFYMLEVKMNLYSEKYEVKNSKWRRGKLRNRDMLVRVTDKCLGNVWSTSNLSLETYLFKFVSPLCFALRSNIIYGCSFQLEES